MLNVKKWWHQLLEADIISFFVTRKCQKIQKLNENQWKWLILTEKFFITSEPFDEFQWNIWERCDLR